jgi:phage host-nuclease inhibitor protein Gam
VAITAETSRLQAELLQLHIIHRDAGYVESQWHASAKEKLGERFRQVGDASKELVRLEAADVEIDNAAAIRRWGAGRGASLEEKIQALDAAVNGVWAMSEPGGRYARLVRRFERWVDGVLDLEEARENGGEALLSGGYDSPFIDDLDATWSDECAGMARKLESWQSHLQDVGDVSRSDEPSSLERVMNGSRSLVEDMLAELEAMEEIRRAALAREDEWIDCVNRDGDEDDTRRAGAVWRGM